MKLTCQTISFEIKALNQIIEFSQAVIFAVQSIDSILKTTELYLQDVLSNRLISPNQMQINTKTKI